MTHALETVPLIPRKLLSGNPARVNPQLSSDGAYLAFLAPVNGVLNVWVGPVDDVEATRPVTKDTLRGIRIFSWAFTSRHVLYSQDQGGDENWRIHSVDVQTLADRDLTPLEGVAAQIQHVSHKDASHILVALNDRDKRYHDIHRVDILSGDRALVQHNDQFAGFVTDDDYDVRLAQRMTDDGGTELLAPAAPGQWRPYLRVGLDDALSFRPAGFSEDGRTLYLSDSRGRNTAALTALDLDTGRKTLLSQDDQADIVNILLHPTRKVPQAVSFTYERRRWQALEAGLSEDFAYLSSLHDADFHVASRTLDDRVWVVAYYADLTPETYYLYRRDQKQATLLFASRPELQGQPLVKMHPLQIQSRDGLTLVSYLTLPPGQTWASDGYAGPPLPMVLIVHGGPWGRDGWGFNADHQWLANRGYAVLSANFRGSTGFGKAFVNAGNRQWGAAMHDDLIDAVNWSVAAGVADPKRVAIYGGSYGGYAALAGLTFTPDVFACAVDIVGPSNIVTLLQTIPPYWAPIISVFTSRVGDHRTDEGRALLYSRSPLNFAARIRRPLLIGQGANDPRVKQSESDQIVGAMQSRGIPVTYVLYGDEGHGFARPENRLSFNAVAEAFLAEHLGGRCQPIGDDFHGSTLQVRAGPEQIAGLPASPDT